MTGTFVVVLGTRSDAIKLAPLIWELASRSNVRSTVVSTGQHREMLDQMLGCFGITPDIDLGVMRPDQRLTDVCARIVAGLGDVFRTLSAPDVVVVHGDTTTALAGALAGFYEGIPVAHVEAGLRSGDLTRPFPEEAHRRMVATVARWHFCPTDRARRHLEDEGVPPQQIFVTGNTVVDSLAWASAQVRGRSDQVLVPERGRRRWRVLLTVHRRENLGGGLARVMAAVRRLVENADLEVVIPMHRNPSVCSAICGELGGVEGVVLSEPLDYLEFIRLVSSCDVVVTDSGGLQEEAPLLGKPLIVLSHRTERAEVFDVGRTVLVGTDPDRIVAAVTAWLVSPRPVDSRRGQGVLGDGHAAKRIVDVLIRREVVSECLP
jgi:UDP-N-acetylglucosamine 2-epimerase (non-hydrolysing)